MNQPTAFRGIMLLGCLTGVCVVSAGCTGVISGNSPTDGRGSSGSGEEVMTPDGVGASTRFPKLSNEQWENTVQDLFFFDTPTGFSSSFVHEPADQGYVSEAAASTTVGGDLWQRYQVAAEQVAGLVTGDDAKLAKILPKNLPSDLDAQATAIVQALGRRTYRRPLTQAEVANYVGLYKQAVNLASGDALHAGTNLVIQTMLQSPHFLYRVESSKAADKGRIWLSGFEVATRLSYAFWNTMPSDELLAAAEHGELASADGVRTWAQKLIADPRADAVLLSFHEQTFGTAQYGTQDKDPSLGFNTDVVGPVLVDEAHRFFDDILQQNGGVKQILTAPTAFVNEDTAPFYELSGVSGKDLRRVSLDPSRRAGLLSQIGYLASNAGRNMSDPVHRGLGVLRRVLCDEPDPPPMMFAAPIPAAGQTTRQVYEARTACGVGCHDILINPAGFAFEHFDAVGKWRDTENGLTIDTKATLTIRSGFTPEAKRQNPSFTITFDGAADLTTQLAGLERTHECYARRLLEFALARPVDPVERGAGAALGDQSIKSGSTRDIISALVTLDAFRARAPEDL